MASSDPPLYEGCPTGALPTDAVPGGQHGVTVATKFAPSNLLDVRVLAARVGHCTVCVEGADDYTPVVCRPGRRAFLAGAQRRRPWVLRVAASQPVMAHQP